MSEHKNPEGHGGADESAAQIKRRLSGLSGEEFTAALADYLEAMDDESFDPAALDAYLCALEEREDAPPDFDAGAALAGLHERYGDLLAQDVPAPLQAVPAARPRRRHPVRRALMAAALAAALLCAAAQAAGFDVIGTIARWSEETFRFQPGAAPEQVPGDALGEATSAMEEYGIPLELLPTWYPEGFELEEQMVSADEMSAVVYLLFTREEDSFSVDISKYSSGDLVGERIYEKDSSPVELYTANGRSFYLFSNLGQLEAAWADGPLTISVGGDLTESELKSILNSMGG